MGKTFGETSFESPVSVRHQSRRSRHPTGRRLSQRVEVHGSALVQFGHSRMRPHKLPRRSALHQVLPGFGNRTSPSGPPEEEQGATIFGDGSVRHRPASRVQRVGGATVNGERRARSNRSVSLSAQKYSLDYRKATAQFHREWLHKALKRCAGNLSEAARKLGVTRRALQLQIARFKIDISKIRRTS